MKFGPLLLALALILPGVTVSAGETSGFRLAGQDWEVPVQAGYCATDDPELAGLAAESLSGLIAVTVMHVRCQDLEQFRESGQPDRFRLLFWGVMVDDGRPMIAGPEMLAELDDLRRLVLAGSEQEHLALAEGIQRGLAQGGTNVHCLSFNAEEDVLGGQLCTSGPDGFRVDLAGAMRPLNDVIAVAVVMHVPGGGPFTPDFSQAAAMLTTMRPVE